MKLADLVELLHLDVRSASDSLDNEVTGGYASDLLSDVMGNAKEGDLWVTLQAHPNIVAVAAMKDLAGIVLVDRREPDGETIQKAEAERIPIFVSSLPAFELAGRLYGFGLRGRESGGQPGGPRIGSAGNEREKTW